MKILIILMMFFSLNIANIDNLIDGFDTSYVKKTVPKKIKSTAFKKTKIISTTSIKLKKETKKPSNTPSFTDSKISNDINIQKNSLSKDEILEASLMQTKEYVKSFYVVIFASIGLFLLLLFIYMIVAAMRKMMLENKIDTVEEIVSQEVRKNKVISKKNVQLLDEIRQLKTDLSVLKASVSKQHKDMANHDSSNAIKQKTKATLTKDDFNFDDDFDDGFDESHNEEINLNDKRVGMKNKNTVSDLSNMNLDIKEEPTKRKTKRKKKTNIEDMEEFNIDDFD